MTNDSTNDDLSELLSAYLDGELGTADRARVEQHLQESAEFRQLRDELQAIRTSLQRLPQYRMDKDLASTVLQHVRSMTEVPVEHQVTLPERTSSTPWLARRVYALKWSIMAVAVALLIMIFGPREKEAGRDVALRTHDAPRDPAAVMSAPTAAAPLSKADADNRPNERDVAAKASKVAAEGSELDSDERVMKKSERSAESGSFSGKAGVSAKAAPRFAAPNAAGRPAKAATPQQPGGVSDGIGAANEELSNDSLSDELLVVRFDITASAARSQAFEKLLTRNKIPLETDVEEQAPSSGPPAAASPLPAVDLAKAKSAKSPLEAKEAAKDRPAAAAQRAENARKQQADREEATDKLSAQAITESDAPLDAYLVEASPEQISATIAGLQTEQNSYRGVQVEAEPTLGPQDELSQQSVEGHLELYEQLNRRGDQLPENRARAARVRNTIEPIEQRQVSRGADLKSKSAGEKPGNAPETLSKNNAPALEANTTQNSRALQQAARRGEGQQRALFLPRVIPDDQPSK